MPKVLILLFLAFAAGCGTFSETADPTSDAPEIPRPQVASFKDAVTYQQALQVWQTPEDINAWIGARFTYDMARAMALSETQRNRSGQLSIYEPHDFFAAPSGVCVDLSRFAVETLRHIAPAVKPNYLMIEFTPVELDGNTLRLHWLTSFRRDGNYYFFADSKRPGHIAGPYIGIPEFVAEYAKYRGRPIVAFQELESYQRKQRTPALKQHREERP
ncbi:MAG: hypothetical protein HY868_10535 [Chloroflexi bacterium]|nr:hypothetical protein [Chloroflexota bacterium]